MTRTYDLRVEFLLQDVLAERGAAMPPAGLEQRLLARLAQTAEVRRPAAAPALFRFAQQVRTPRSRLSLMTAVMAHAAVLALIAVLAMHRTTITSTKMATTMLVAPPVIPPPSLRMERSGGGGGQHDTAPAMLGHLPKLATEQMMPPKAPPTIAPKLAVMPSVVVQKDLQLADNKLPNMGLPSSSLHGVSMGDGSGTGIGSGNGNGIGPGAGGNVGGGPMHIGGAVHAPTLVYQPDAEFSEEARKAKFSGNVLVSLWVDGQGRPSHIRVARGAGMGLDEKAVEAVRQYKFKPATKDGKPVTVELTIDVGFQIY